MVTTLTKPIKSKAGNNGGSHYFGKGNGGESFGWNDSQHENSAKIGLFFLMATITMLFGAIMSALIIRRASADWKPLYFPPLLWLNTGVLLLSSLTLEISRQAIGFMKFSRYRIGLTVSALLGVLFLIGQIFAWRALAAHGVFLPTNPHSSFFYLLSGLHAAHLLGGVIALWLVTFRAWRGKNLIAQKATTTRVAIYWHFLDILWIYLLIALFI